MKYVVHPHINFCYANETSFAVQATVWLVYQVYRLIPRKMINGEELASEAKARTVCGPN